MKSFVAWMLTLAVVLGTSMLAGAEEKKDIVDTAVVVGSFKTLVAALKAADLVETLKGEGPFTVFAPSDEAFAEPTAGAFFNPDKKFSTKTTCGKYLVRYRAVKAGTSEIRWQLYRQREDGKEVDVDGLDYFAEYVLPVKVE